MDPSTPLRLMCITAHPDDEAGGFGGALMTAAAAGIETAVLCLTEGSSGSYREEGQSDEELGKLRREEFHAACAYLGVCRATLLTLPDGKLWQQPLLPLIQRLTGHIRAFRPHVVLTFGGEGGVNQHRDHTVVSLAATAAFHWAGTTTVTPETPDAAPWAPQKLYYLATPFLSSENEEVQRTGTRAPATLRLPLGPLRERKIEAFRRHASQRGLLHRVLARFQGAFDDEGYLLVAARNPDLAETSLWDGVEAEPTCGTELSE